MKQEDLKEILALLAESEKMAYCLATHDSAIKFDYEYPEIKNRLELAIEKVKFEIDNKQNRRKSDPISVKIEFNKDQVDQWFVEAAAKYIPIKRQE